MKKNIFLSVIAIVEGIVIIVLAASRHHAVYLFVKTTPVTGISPLETALNYESSDAKFSDLVKKYPSWIKYRQSEPDKTLGMPILGDCALMNRTDFVRILITNNADVTQALSALNGIGATNAIKLIEQVQNEISSKP